ncbi:MULTISPECIES: diguanylate cyclase [Sulfurimonas]|uniref:GGDEF domain-containing protein n=1 Tax=Sulfurimonas TaxID=202746 RepID=UPI001263DA58|nr:diguanylate cyclase [Sulfurimonas indica]
MKQSIKKIFQNLNTYLLFVLFVAILGMLLVLEHSLSFDKVDNLRNQKKIISTLTKLDKSDLELALIQFNGKSTRLHQEINKLRTLYKYAYIDKYVLKNEQEYFADLQKLSELTDTFNKAAKEYYVDTRDIEREKTAKRRLDVALYTINKHIDSMLLKTITYNEEKFYFVKNAIVVIFILILLATFYYRRTLNAIYKDIEFLYQVEKHRKTYTIFSQEADAIALRMNRKNTSSDNPDFLDPVTGINNHKGLINSYSMKKGAKESNFTSVTVLEIDNFSKSNRAFPQDVTQAILKKIAYTISLHEQAIDVIARTDFNQFTIIFSRSSKEQSYKDVELIRESIAELKFNIPHQGSTQITVSGGFVIKPNNTSLEEAMKQAKEILHYAQSTGTNRILQARDLAQREI